MADSATTQDSATADKSTENLGDNQSSAAKPQSNKITIGEPFSAWGRDNNIVESISVDGGPKTTSDWKIKDGSRVEIFGRGLDEYNQVSLWVSGGRELVEGADVRIKRKVGETKNDKGTGLEFKAKFAKNRYQDGSLVEVELQRLNRPENDRSFIKKFIFSETQDDAEEEAKKAQAAQAAAAAAQKQNEASGPTGFLMDAAKQSLEAMTGGIGQAKKSVKPQPKSGLPKDGSEPSEPAPKEPESFGGSDFDSGSTAQNIQTEEVEKAFVPLPVLNEHYEQIEQYIEKNPDEIVNVQDRQAITTSLQTKDFSTLNSQQKETLVNLTRKISLDVGGKNGTELRTAAVRIKDTVEPPSMEVKESAESEINSPGVEQGAASESSEPGSQPQQDNAELNISESARVATQPSQSGASPAEPNAGKNLEGVNKNVVQAGKSNAGRVKENEEKIVQAKILDGAGLASAGTEKAAAGLSSKNPAGEEGAAQASTLSVGARRGLNQGGPKQKTPAQPMEQSTAAGSPLSRGSAGGPQKKVGQNSEGKIDNIDDVNKPAKPAEQVDYSLQVEKPEPQGQDQEADSEAVQKPKQPIDGLQPKPSPGAREVLDRLNAKKPIPGLGVAINIDQAGEKAPEEPINNQDDQENETQEPDVEITASPKSKDSQPERKISPALQSDSKLPRNPLRSLENAPVKRPESFKKPETPLATPRLPHEEMPKPGQKQFKMPDGSDQQEVAKSPAVSGTGQQASAEATPGADISAEASAGDVMAASAAPELAALAPPLAAALVIENQLSPKLKWYIALGAAVLGLPTFVGFYAAWANMVRYWKQGEKAGPGKALNGFQKAATVVLFFLPLLILTVFIFMFLVIGCNWPAPIKIAGVASYRGTILGSIIGDSCQSFDASNLAATTGFSSLASPSSPFSPISATLPAGCLPNHCVVGNPAADISLYATDPAHEAAVISIYNSSYLSNADFSSPAGIDAYLHRTVPSTPLTGAMIFSAAQQYHVDAKLMTALMQQDSSLGTQGKGAKSNNPGNVGSTSAGSIYDSGNRTTTFPDWQSGVNAVAQWLSNHRA